MSELVCKTLDHDATDVLIDKWLEHRNDAYWDWFMHVRERRHSALHGLQRRATACLEQRRFCPGEHLYAHRGHCTTYTPRPYVDDACVPSSLHARSKALYDAGGIHDGVYTGLYAAIVGD
jgi:hypothetical protein